MVFLDDDSDLWFPHPEIPFLDDCIAVGGDLSRERLMLAYRHGIFPMYDFMRDKHPYWYAPKRRFVIFPGEIHVSHSMRTLLNKHEHRVTFNRHFQDVIIHCATVNNRHRRRGAWLGPQIIKAYSDLHETGYAESVEVWRGEELVGGLYGVVTGTGFAGESMFSLEPEGSKIALIALARKMQAEGGTLIDCQFHTPHLKSMGGRYISYKQYITTLFGRDAYHTWQECPALTTGQGTLESKVGKSND